MMNLEDTLGFWTGKKVLVTGGGGFIGSHLCEELVDAGAVVTSGDIRAGHIATSPKKGKIKFMKIDFFKNTECMKKIKGFDMVMHLAAKVGGINYNMKYMADIYIDNLLMTSNVIKSVTANKIKGIMLTSSACVYPGDAVVPTPESEGFRGVPEVTNEGYGWAKRNLETAGKMIKKQYGTEVAIVRPYNAYGPRDKFDLENAHVIAALINKVFNAKEGKIDVWGSGEQTRSFLYCKDAAKGMMLAMEKYAQADPVNLGSDEEITIKDLTALIIELSGRKIEIVYKRDVPEGYKRRKSDNTLAREKMGFNTVWKLKDGLAETVEYYKKNFVK